MSAKKEYTRAIQVILEFACCKRISRAIQVFIEELKGLGVEISSSNTNLRWRLLFARCIDLLSTNLSIDVLERLIDVFDELSSLSEGRGDFESMELPRLKILHLLALTQIRQVKKEDPNRDISNLIIKLIDRHFVIKNSDNEKSKNTKQDISIELNSLVSDNIFKEVDNNWNKRLTLFKSTLTVFINKLEDASLGKSMLEEYIKPELEGQDEQITSNRASIIKSMMKKGVQNLDEAFEEFIQETSDLTSLGDKETNLTKESNTTTNKRDVNREKDAFGQEETNKKNDSYRQEKSHKSKVHKEKKSPSVVDNPRHEIFEKPWGLPSSTKKVVRDLQQATSKLNNTYASSLIPDPLEHAMQLEAPKSYLNKASKTFNRLNIPKESATRVAFDDITDEEAHPPLVLPTSNVPEETPLTLLTPKKKKRNLQTLRNNLEDYEFETSIQKKRKTFTEEEVSYILDGYLVYGKQTEKWKKILMSYNFQPGRTSVDIKDKWRNLSKKGFTPLKNPIKKKEGQIEAISTSSESG